MKEATKIRIYEIKDKAAVLGLFDLNTPAFFAVEEKQDLIRYLDSELEYYCVLELGGSLAGCGGINFSKDGAHARISWDLIDPRLHGKGLGSLLLKHRLEILRTNKSVQTITVRTSQLAYLFYQKNGFVLVETQRDYWAKGFDLYRMDYPMPN